MAANEVATKMEQPHVSTTNVKVPVQVMTKDLKNVAQGKRLVEINRNNKEKLAQAAKTQESEPNLSQAYGVGAVKAVGVLGLLCYYVNQSRKGDTAKDATKVTPVRSVETQKRTNKFEME